MDDRHKHSGKKEDIVSIFSIVIMCLVTLVCGYDIITGGTAPGSNAFFDATISVIGMLLSIILTVGCYLGNPERSRSGKFLFAAAVSLFLELFLSYVITSLSGSAENARMMTVVLTVNYCIIPFSHTLFIAFQWEGNPHYRFSRPVIVWLIFLGILFELFTISNLFTGYYFIVSGEGEVIRTGEIIDLIITIVFYISYLIFVFASRYSVSKKISFSLYVVFPAIYTGSCLLFPNVFPVSDSVSFMFNLLAAYLLFINIFITDKTELMKHRTELAEQEKEQTRLETALTLSQIGPHFIFNSLATISGLSGMENAPMTKEAVDHFAHYLRGNLDSIGGGRLISFEKELDHVKNYLWIQQLRFGEELKVEYDIQCRDFSLPSLILQPLVENAVNHGIQRKRGGGTILITTAENETGVVITVSDNGIGFDINIPVEDGRTHIGIDSVRSRLNALCSGELSIESKPGSGTTACITIPWGNDDEYNDR